LVRKTVERSKELGGNSNAIGKSRTHWDNLHQTVAFRDLRAKAGVVHKKQRGDGRELVPVSL
jgi:hypothetical protein